MIYNILYMELQTNGHGFLWAVVIAYNGNGFLGYSL